MTISDWIARANKLLEGGRSDDAVSLVRNIAATGDPEALFRLAFWQIIGDPLPRDLAAARVLLRQAAAFGHLDARRIEIAMLANGSGAPPDWALAMRRLQESAAVDPEALAVARLLDAMAIDADGGPHRLPQAIPLAPDDAVVRLPALLTQGECAHVARTVADILAPSVVLDPGSGRQVRNSVRTSDEAIIGPLREDPVIRAINLRIAAASGTDVRQGEALTVLRYRVGEQFHPHHDAIGRTRNERVMTMIVYLNEGFSGGETVFPEYDLTIIPKGGDAILFRNALPDGSLDRRARHAGMPVRAGAKWIATRWIRTRAYDMWQGPETASDQTRS